jgi:hypothetical protein
MPRATRARTRGALATRNAGEDNASGDVASHPTKAVGAAKRAAAGAADGARAALAEEVEREIREMELERECRDASTRAIRPRRVPPRVGAALERAPPAPNPAATPRVTEPPSPSPSLPSPPQSRRGARR